MEDFGKKLDEWQRAAFRFGQRNAKVVVPAAMLLAGVPSTYHLCQSVFYPPVDTGIETSRYDDEVSRDNVADITFARKDQQYNINGILKDTGAKFTTTYPVEMIGETVKSLRSKNVHYKMMGNEYEFSLVRDGPTYFSLSVTLAAGLAGASLLSKKMGLGDKLKRISDETSDRVTFADVAGVDEAKEDLQEIVDFLKDPEKYKAMGAEIPSGVVLSGPPGSGKTLLARAIAGEAGVPVYTISASDFVDGMMGTGAKLVKKMFAKAKKTAPCIIIIDEIEILGGSREQRGSHSVDEERNQTINAILEEIDGIHGDSGVMLIGITNLEGKLDEALTRAGRLERSIHVPYADRTGREKILKICARKVRMDKDIDWSIIAKRTSGFSNAGLKQLVNEAALMAVRHKKQAVGMDELNAARDKILMGAERRYVLSDEEKKRYAYHEGGHALVALKKEGAPKLEKATLIPRGTSMGSTHMEHQEKSSADLRELEGILAMLMGGREAERALHGDKGVSTGAEKDIEEVTRLAGLMVRKWGMSDLGRVNLVGENGKGLESEVQAEIKKIADAAEQDARRILTDNKDCLDAIAAALLERETLTGQDMIDIIDPIQAQRPFAVQYDLPFQDKRAAVA